MFGCNFEIRASKSPDPFTAQEMAKAKAKQPAKAAKPSVQPNKFETLYNRKKFNVLGKKSKGDKQARGKARSDGTEKVPVLHTSMCDL